MTRRMVVWIAILTGLLAVTAVWGYGQMAASRDSAALAAVDLAECRRLAGQIEACRSRPSVATESERGTNETNGPIERAATAAGIAVSGHLLRIAPEQAQRVGDTVYKEKPTRVFLKDVSLKQLVTLIYSLTGPEFGLRAKSLRLSAPQTDDASDSWTSELVLTYLIYEPLQPTKP